MGKAAGLLPSWYWPEGVQRYVSAPPIALDELCVGRWARRYGGNVALQGQQGQLTFRELNERVGRIAGAILARWGDAPRLALYAGEPLLWATAFFAGARLGCQLLLLDTDLPLDAQGWALESFRPTAVLDDVAVHNLQEAQGPTPAGRRPDASAPVIALPEGKALVYHSHVSLASGAMALAAFLQLDPQEKVVAVSPWGRWEGLLTLLAHLQGGGTALASPSSWEALSEAVAHHRPKALWLPASLGWHVLEEKSLREAVRRARPWLLMGVEGPVAKAQRRRWRRLLGTHVLTAYGFAATGVIAASHPSWYLDEAVGIPMTGVDLIPIDPASRAPVEAPWEVLTYAGIGVRTRALAPRIEGEGPYYGLIAPDLFYTGRQGWMDPNGMLYLLDGR
jgi:acyl-CoA synthetase (AMP-forming)/AMP-acid ligase II